MLDDKVALRKESVDRNIVPGHDLIGQGLSLSARRAWIEITLEMIHETLKNVALRKESVDRNVVHFQPRLQCLVSLSARRAWIEICHSVIAAFRRNMSLSARRAWIEIGKAVKQMGAMVVALRKESVDRNCPIWRPRAGRAVALRKESVDRNYMDDFVIIGTRAVALRKESVDRNVFGSFRLIFPLCRSPQGERG